MTCTYYQFLTDLYRFIQISDKLKDGWVVREIDSIKFMCKKTYLEAYKQNGSGSIMSCDYHVIYNSSYSVPVLYFTAATSDTGKRLSLEEIWPFLPSSLITSNKWSMITGTDHPLLSTPCYYIHPCHTNTLMNSLDDVSFYLLTWLSSLGPLIGIDIPIQYSNS